MEADGARRLANAVTAAWDRIDLFLTPDLAGRARDRLKALHDPRDLLARALSCRAGADWPERFEAATARRLRTALGVEMPRGQ